MNQKKMIVRFCPLHCFWTHDLGATRVSVDGRSGAELAEAKPFRTWLHSLERRCRYSAGPTQPCCVKKCWAKRDSWVSTLNFFSMISISQTCFQWFEDCSGRQATHQRTHTVFEKREGTIWSTGGPPAFLRACRRVAVLQDGAGGVGLLRQAQRRGFQTRPSRSVQVLSGVHNNTCTINSHILHALHQHASMRMSLLLSNSWIVLTWLGYICICNVHLHIHSFPLCVRRACVFHPPSTWELGCVHYEAPHHCGCVLAMAGCHFHFVRLEWRLYL